MKVLSYTPRLPLAHFVELFWISEGNGFAHGKERVLPSRTMQLVVSLCGASFMGPPGSCQGPRGAVISGPRSEPLTISSPGQVSLLGVHFKPGGAFPFLGLPAGELHNTHVSLETLWGRIAVELQDRLLQAKSAQAC